MVFEILRKLLKEKIHYQLPLLFGICKKMSNKYDVNLGVIYIFKKKRE